MVESSRRGLEDRAFFYPKVGRGLFATRAHP